MNPETAFARNIRTVFKIFIALAGAAVMIAAASDVAHSAALPAAQTTEREVIPGADR